MVRRVRGEGRSPGSVALDVGVSERTVHKWLARYRAEGVAGLDVPLKVDVGWGPDLASVKA